jgi:hypothetical protein
MQILNNSLLSIKILARKKALSAFFLLGQTVSIIAILFSLSSSYNTINSEMERGTYEISFATPADYGVCIDLLKELYFTTSFDNSVIYIDSSKTMIASYPNGFLVSHVGKGIDMKKDEPQIVFGDIKDRPDIGETVEVLGIGFKVVGYGVMEDIIELHPGFVPEESEVYEITIYKRFISNADTEKFTSTITGAFEGASVVSPNPLKLKDITNRFFIEWIIILLSFTALMAGYTYLNKKRGRLYETVRLLGGNKFTLAGLLLSELFIMSSATFIFASLLYLVLEHFLLHKLFIYVYGFAYKLGLQYYFLAFAVTLSLALAVSALLIVKLSRANIKTEVINE